MRYSIKMNTRKENKTVIAILLFYSQRITNRVTITVALSPDSST